MHERVVMLALVEVPVDEAEDPPEVWMTDGRIPELAGIRVVWSRRVTVVDRRRPSPSYVRDGAGDWRERPDA